MNEFNQNYGVVSATIELDLVQPPSAYGLLLIANAFDRVGYTKLARYLRSCGDVLSDRLAVPTIVDGGTRAVAGDAGELPEMTPQRAIYFLERFKRDEKMLGPNEQASLDFAIRRLATAEQHAKSIRVGFSTQGDPMYANVPAEQHGEARFVPGVMHCAKCNFRLVRTNFYAANGAISAGDNKTEPCPNGCGPLWPVTWEQEARECWARLEELAGPPPAPAADHIVDANKKVAPAAEQGEVCESRAPDCGPVEFHDDHGIPLCRTCYEALEPETLVQRRAREAGLSVVEAQPEARGVEGMVLAEVERATAKFPTWPTDPLHAVAVLGEEFGELTKAVLQSVYEPHKNPPGAVRTEALQTAAMALRFLASVDRYEAARCPQHKQGEQ